MVAPGKRTAAGRRLRALSWALGGTLLALELGLRLWILVLAPAQTLGKYARPGDLPPEGWLYLPHPYLSFCLNPAYRSADGLNRHNSLGFRGEEFPREKPPGSYRIVCMGGSTTYDVSVPDWRLAFPAQLERSLREEHGHESVRVINAGVPDYTTWECVINFQLRVRELEPDLVIVYHNTNDARARLVPPEVFRRDGTGYRHAWVVRDPWWDRSMLARFLGVQWGFSPRNRMDERTRYDWPEAPDYERVLAANGTAYLSENLENLVTLAAHDGIEVLLTSFAYCAQLDDFAAQPRFVQAYRENNEAIAALARRLGVPFYDFAAEMPDDGAYYSNGVHNNEAGARLKAGLFATYLDRTLLRSVP